MCCNLPVSLHSPDTIHLSDPKYLLEKNMKKLFIGTLTACLIASTAVYADATSERKAAMKNVGMAMGAMVKMVKGEAEYDPQTALLAFAVMNNAATGLTSMFPDGSQTGGETTAKDTIWSDMAGFAAATDKFRVAAAEAIAAKPADLDAFKAVFGKVAGNCKSCHEAYRVPKD